MAILSNPTADLANFYAMVSQFDQEFELMYREPMDNYANQALYICARLGCSVGDVMCAWAEIAD